MTRIQALMAFLALAAAVRGETPTQLDLRTQAKSVDFSSANTTRPFKSGTTLPAACSTGDMYFKTDAPSGANVYGCVAQNTWALESGGTMPALGGDITGTPNAATVTQIQGRPVASMAPAPGQALVWNGTTSRWEPFLLAAGGGSGSGAAMGSQLGDFLVAKSASPSVLDIGANCSSATPCLARFGSIVYSYTTSGSLTLTSGSGDVYIYIASGGALTAGHNMNVSCSGACIAAAGVTAFPYDSIPLFKWHATNGSWDPAGMDQRALLSTKNVAYGAGLTTTEDPATGRTVIGADQTQIGIRASPPSSAASPCTSGAWATDANYYYVCVGQNTWRRAALSSW